MSSWFAATLAILLSVTAQAAKPTPASGDRCHRYAKACGICFTLPRTWRVKVFSPTHREEICSLSAALPQSEYGFSISVDSRPFEAVAADNGFTYDGYSAWSVMG